VIVVMDDDLAMAETLAMNKIHGEMAPADVAVILRDIQGEIPYGELETFTGYTGGELEKLDNLLAFDWDDLKKVTADEEWHTLGWKMPAEAAEVVMAEIERIKQILGTEYDHLALEVMSLSSAQLVK